MNSKGFTMIETIIVVIIIGIMAMLVGIGYSSSRSYSRTTAREQMVQAIRNARMEAIARNTFVGLQLKSGSSNSFTLNTYTESAGNYTLAATVNANIIIGDINDTTIQFTNLNNFAGGSGFLFNSRGALVNAGGTPVITRVHFHSNSDAEHLHIQIEPTTGYTSTFEE